MTDKKPFTPELLAEAEARMNAIIIKDEKTGCWILPVGNTAKNGPSAMMVDGVFKLGTNWAWAIWRGDTNGRKIFRTCDDRRCVNPDHLYLSRDYSIPKPTPNEVFAKQVARARARSPINEEIAAEIRDREEPGVVLAKQYSLPTGTISRIRLRRSWWVRGIDYDAEG